MLRKGLSAIVIALAALSLLVMSVMAQGDDEAETPVVTVQPNLAAANVVQTVPVTLTLTIPGPDGPITVEVPVFLSLDIRIGISPEMTPSLAITPAVVLETSTPTATAQSTAVPTVAATVVATPDSDEDEADDTETELEVAPTPTPSPTAPAPTATPVPVEPTDEPSDEPAGEATPTEVILPTATPAITPEPEPVGGAPICPDQRSVIVSPGVGEIVSGTVNILGTAVHENFLYYKVEYAPGENIDPNETFVYLADARVQVTGGLLAAFDSTNFADGPYTIKLTVVDNSGNFPPPCTVTVVVRN